jgi:hypothetical protein
MQVFATTAEERAAMKLMGEREPKDSYAYCAACIRVLKNPITAYPLIKGFAQVTATVSGVNPEVAEKAAEKFATNLIRGKKL